MRSGQQPMRRASPSWLSAVDPRTKLMGLLLVSLASVLLDGVYALASLAVALTMLATSLRLARRQWFVIAGLTLATVWGTVLSQSLFYRGEDASAGIELVPAFDIWLWQFPGLALRREGAEHGLVQSLRLAAMLLGGMIVCMSTSPERLLAALVQCRVPTALAFMVVAALRFLPTTVDQWATVREACRLRGGRSARGFERLQLELAMLVPILAAALRRADQLATSVTSRGFDPQAQRTYYPQLRFRAWERIAIWGFVVVGIALATVKSLVWAAQANLGSASFLGSLYRFAESWL